MPGEAAVTAYRRYPCDECPIRADNAGNPASSFPAHRWDVLSRTVCDPQTGEHPGYGDPLFGCHKGAPGSGDDLACAGWLVRFGRDHLRVRMALASGRLPVSAIDAGPDWPPLHETWADVRRSQTAD